MCVCVCGVCVYVIVWCVCVCGCGVCAVCVGVCVCMVCVFVCGVCVCVCVILKLEKWTVCFRFSLLRQRKKLFIEI